MAQTHKMGSKRRREHREACIARDGNTCQHCQQPFTEQLRPTIDHIHPYSLGGLNRVANFQLLCAPCNVARDTWVRSQTPTDPAWQPLKPLTKKQRSRLHDTQIVTVGP